MSGKRLRCHACKYRFAESFASARRGAGVGAALGEITGALAVALVVAVVGVARESGDAEGSTNRVAVGSGNWLTTLAGTSPKFQAAVSPIPAMASAATIPTAIEPRALRRRRDRMTAILRLRTRTNPAMATEMQPKGLTPAI